MHMGVRDFLPGCLAGVRTGIESGNAWVEPFDLVAAWQGDCMDGLALSGACLEDAGGVPFGDDERVERLSGELVANGKRQLIFCDQAKRVEVTKYAIVLPHRCPTLFNSHLCAGPGERGETAFEVALQILDPLPDIHMDLAKAPRVRLKRPHGQSFSPVLALLRTARLTGLLRG
jgi:hypothetical protein